MATLNDWLTKFGLVPVGGEDPFAAFRLQPDEPYPTPSTSSEPVVPMFKRPGRFKTPLLPIVGAYDADGITAGQIPGANAPIIGIQIVPQNSKRTGLIIRNAGYGTAFISSFNQVSRLDFPIPPLEDITIVPSSALNIAPTNAIYAIGEVGADLRILEIVFAPVSSEFIA
jgi:hypothetical protein